LRNWRENRPAALTGGGPHCRANGPDPATGRPGRSCVGVGGFDSRGRTPVCNCNGTSTDFLPPHARQSRCFTRKCRQFVFTSRCAAVPSMMVREPTSPERQYREWPLDRRHAEGGHDHRRTGDALGDGSIVEPRSRKPRVEASGVGRDWDEVGPVGRVGRLVLDVACDANEWHPGDAEPASHSVEEFAPRKGRGQRGPDQLSVRRRHALVAGGAGGDADHKGRVGCRSAAGGCTADGRGPCYAGRGHSEGVAWNNERCGGASCPTWLPACCSSSARSARTR